MGVLARTMSAVDEARLWRVLSNRGYKPVRPLGKGGMSQVWLATDTRGTHVAVKVPNRDPEAVKRLGFEISLLQSLRHEHIVNFISAFDVSGYPILVMEYAKGNNLELSTAGKAMDEREALARAVQILLAVDYLHSRGVIHRDIKPKNIIVGNEKTYLKLIDLGTATFFSQAGITESVFSPGGYTPPEQFKSMASPQGDVWSVGATLYFMLTGQHPALDMPGYPDAKCNPPDPRKWNKDISDSTVAIIAKAMRWEPTERFSSPMEMIMAIEGRTPQPEPDVPVLEVLGRRIRIEASRLVFKWGGNIPEGIRVVKEADTMYVYINDPHRWVSREHFEIFKSGNKWYLRDLGSLNRTAVRVGGVIREVWVGYKKPSPPVALERGSIIYVAYGDSLTKPPYVVLTFK